jgi:hypothetical protein
MTTATDNSVDTGLEVTDLRGNVEFASRRIHTRNTAAQIEGMRRLAEAFVEDPFTILDVLVELAVKLCGADSAGISIEREEHIRTDESFYQWVATAGAYRDFLNALLPREPSACTICLERNGPQLFRVFPRFFEMMGVDAKPVTDGLLIPWEIDETRGTLWILAHGRDQAFDSSDLSLMQILADFAAMAIRHQRQQLQLMEQAGAAAAAEMANGLAHQINNPLQCLTNLLFLAQQGRYQGDPAALAHELAPHLDILTNLVTLLLSLPATSTRQ